jgi:predicted nucleic acid-binding protein
VDAFDADVLIYAAVPHHDLGRRVRALLLAEAEAPEAIGGVGSVLLIPELLTKPKRAGSTVEYEELNILLSRLSLLPVDQATANLATTLGARYGLRAADAVHLATAVLAGADRFVTNNSADFPRTITEIEVIYPDDLPAPAGL